MNLYEINQEMKATQTKLEEWAIANDGDITDCPLEAELNALELTREEKAINMGLWVKNLSASQTALKTEAKNLSDRAGVIGNKIDRLKSFMSDFLPNDTKIEDSRCKISFRPSEVVEVDNVKEIPKKFQKVKDPTADKTALKKAIKAGQHIEGVAIVKNFNLQVK